MLAQSKWGTSAEYICLTLGYYSCQRLLHFLCPTPIVAHVTNINPGLLILGIAFLVYS